MRSLPRSQGALATAALLSILAAACQGGGSTASAPSGPPPQVVTMDEGLPDPVARVGGEAISLDTLETEAAAGVVRARQQMYEARRQALERMIDTQLAEAEAKKRGITAEELVKAEVDGKLTPPSDAEIAKFYEERKDRIKKPLEEVKDRIVQMLERQKRGERDAAFRESLRAAANVEIYLAAPLMKVSADDDPRKGPADAPVQIIEFSDFQCPYCGKAAETVEAVVQKYGDKVSVVYRDFPLPMHKEAHRASQAAQCANDQGKFWQYHDVLFKNVQKMKDEDLQEHATTAGLDVEKFKSCLSANTHVAEIDKDIADGKKVGMSGTPGFFINGRFLGGARPVEDFAAIIDEELAKAAKN